MFNFLLLSPEGKKGRKKGTQLFFSPLQYCCYLLIKELRPLFSPFFSRGIS